jgi:ribosome-associated toxin RatA of RatAB toxin-antitoxin module
VPNACQTVEVNVPPERFWAVVTDFQNYPDFLPHVRGTRVERRDGSGWQVEFELNFIRPIRYTLLLEGTAPHTLTWSLVSGLFRSNQGSWQLEPLSDGMRTLATYTIDLQIGVFLPGSLINTLVRQLPEMLQAFKDRAEGL